MLFGHGDAQRASGGAGAPSLVEVSVAAATSLRQLVLVDWACEASSRRDLSSECVSEGLFALDEGPEVWAAAERAHAHLHCVSKFGFFDKDAGFSVKKKQLVACKVQIDDHSLVFNAHVVTDGLCSALKDLVDC